MEFKCIEKDIREVSPENKVIAHCIAADLGWGSGIAPVIIREVFDAELRCRYKCSNNPDGVPASTNLQPGDILPVEARGGYLVNLITKTHSWDKPTYRQLADSLIRLKAWLQSFDSPKEIVMPQIGCGLDRLEWTVVSLMIKGIFYGMDVDITIVYKGKADGRH
jgi:O-acetyl-ADP-ribose deacetylase (regulator of RNase III)